MYNQPVKELINDKEKNRHTVQYLDRSSKSDKTEVLWLTDVASG